MKCIKREVGYLVFVVCHKSNWNLMWEHRDCVCWEGGGTRFVCGVHMLGFVCLSLKKGKKCKVGIRFVSKHMQIVQWQVPFFPKQKKANITKLPSNHVIHSRYLTLPKLTNGGPPSPSVSQSYNYPSIKWSIIWQSTVRPNSLVGSSNKEDISLENGY